MAEKAKNKKAYQKPLITQVRLVPEEAVLAGCKNITAGPEFSGGCQVAGTCRDKRS